MLTEYRRELPLFGSRVVVLVGAPPAGEMLSAELAASVCEATLRRMQRALSRFEPESELSRLNRDPRETVPVSPLLIRLLEASAFAAERTRGLVDPTVLGAVRAAGYRRSRVGERPAQLDQALAGAPPRRLAQPRPDARWCEIVLDRAAGTVTRPPGVGIDSGGIGKGLAADLCAAQLEPYSSYAVDCGGDLRIGGAGTAPRRVTVDDPFGRGREIGLELERGAVATSGIAGRIWERDGGFAHHLIDPSRGVPAWTGVVQATALAPTAVEAEALAKAAVLSGPEAGRDWLRRWGGVILAEDGVPEPVGAAATGSAMAVCA